MKTRISQLKTVTVSLFVLALLAVSSRAALFEDFFTNASGTGIWEEDFNWSTTTYPDNGHTRPDGNGDPIPGPNPTYDAVLLISSLCTLSIGVTVESVTIATGATLAISSNGVLKLNGPMSNNGTIQMNSTGIVAEMVLPTNSRFEPGSEVRMSANLNNNIYAVSHGDTLTIASGAVVHGSGQLNVGFFGDTRHLLNFINQGAIQADQASVPLYIGVDDGVNAQMNNGGGTLLATGGATLVLRTFGGMGTVLNSGGFIQALNGSTVRVDTGVTVDGGTLTTEGTGAIHGSGIGGTVKNVTNTGTIIVAGNENLGLGGNVVNNGTISLEATSVSPAADLIFHENTTLSGNGIVTMSDSSQNGFFASANGISLTISPGATIQGAGTLWHYQGGNQLPLSLTNQGVIQANRVGNGLLLYLTGSTPIMENTGTLRARDGATLMLLTNSSTGTLNNAGGGRIEALDGSTVSVGSGVTIEGGTLSSSGTGVIRGSGGTISNVTNTGTMITSASASLGLANTFTNNGVLQLDGGYGVINGDITLAGNGTLSMSGGGLYSASGPGHTITIESDATIEGWGTLGVYLGGNQQPLNYVNHGLIHATDPANPLNLFSAGAVATFPNTGTLQASDGASIQLIGNGSPVTLVNEGGTIDVQANSGFNTQQNFGASQTSGTIILDGIMSIPSGLDLNGGELIGSGTFIGPLRNNGGIIGPGHSPGTMTVSGNYTQGADGTLNIQIGGTTAGTEFDQLQVTGTASLGGTLNVSLIDGFRPTPGQTFTVISSNSIAGEFATIKGATAIVTPEGLVVQVLVPGQALNISTRLRVQTGDNVLIGGFIVTGTKPKKILLRAIGPSLGALGVEGVLADPVLELHEPGDVVVTNDNWKDTQEAEITATTIPPADDLESAIVATLAPGPYTAIVSGKGGGMGVALVEAYDLDQTAGLLANISTRGFVDTDPNEMIGGFIVGGGSDGEAATVLIRAIGPSLTAFGVEGALQDPTLELHDGNGNTLMTNDNWKDTQEAEITATTIPPTDDLESAILATLEPGGYTAIVRGKNNTAGVALVEAYNLQ